MLLDDEYNHRVRMRRLENNRESEELSANRSKEREHRRIVLQLEYDHQSSVLLRELGHRQSALDMELGQERAILAIRQQGPGSNTSKSGETQPSSLKLKTHHVVNIMGRASDESGERVGDVQQEVDILTNERMDSERMLVGTPRRWVFASGEVRTAVSSLVLARLIFDADLLRPRACKMRRPLAFTVGDQLPKPLKPCSQLGWSVESTGRRL